MFKAHFLSFVTASAFVVPMFSQSVPISSVPGLGKVLPPTNACTGQAGLACAIPNLYGPYGLALPNPTHAAHFNSSFQSNFSALNEAIATQLTLLPLASPASGFTYKIDPTTGVITRSAESFGPVLTERAETIGRHKFYVGVTFQRFRFDKLDGIPLHNLPVVFTHEPNSFRGQSEPFETQFISTTNSLDLKVNQFTVFGTYGLTDHIDVSVAVPFLDIGFNAASYATINRTVDTEPLGFVKGAFVPCCSMGPPYAHYFDPKNPATSLTRTFSNGQSSPDIFANPAKTGDLYWDPSNNSAAGIGDVTVRFKASVYRSERVSLALLSDLRFPSGDERNFLGSGAYGVKPFAALSVRTGWLTPHVNLGYQWNGSSLLAGDVLTGTKSNLPGFAFFSVGTDFGVWRKLTLAADYLGQELINAPRVESATYTSLGPLVTTGQVGTFPTITTADPNGAPLRQTYNQSNAAVGFKYNIFGRLLFTGNVLVALNQGGLRERVAPLIGLSYTY